MPNGPLALAINGAITRGWCLLKQRVLRVHHEHQRSDNLTALQLQLTRSARSNR